MTKQKHFFLIRGLIREGKHWGAFPESLEAAFPGSQVHNIDMPGAGENFKTPSPLTVKTMVEQMRRVYLEKVNPADECVMVAISLGGMICAEWMKHYPEDFKSVVLINTSYGGLSHFYERMRPKAFFHLMKTARMQGRDKEAHILRVVLNHSSRFDQTLDLWEGIQKERPVSLSNTLRQLTAAGLFRIGSFRPSVPVLLLASTHDRMVNVSCSRAIAEHWKLPLIEHPTAGHDLGADDPQWIVRQMEEFFTTERASSVEAPLDCSPG